MNTQVGTVSVRAQALEAKRVFPIVWHLSESQRTSALLSIADQISANEKKILEANEIDVSNAVQSQQSTSMIDRLRLTAPQLRNLVKSIREVAYMEPVVNRVIDERKRPNGLKIIEKTVPIGVIGFIFESRPNVLIDAAVLAIKSGNTILLKGGREAEYTNQCLGGLITKGIETYIPSGAIQILSGLDRSIVNELLAQHDVLDLIIPRGGESLIQYVKSNTKIPVIAHDKGLCHIYIHSDALQDKTVGLVVNAKTQRPGVCNAVETVLIHRDWPLEHVLTLLQALKNQHVEIRGDATIASIDSGIQKAQDFDWETEYLDRIVSIRYVSNVEDAIAHIQKYGSKHTEAICTEDMQVALTFETQVDASVIMINASTRFNDGGELGLGPEIGISTSKIHCYGPMGASALTTRRFIVTGDGHCR